jgi:N-acetylglucosaminyldiphosphoundecaprenol N-acetyl-beta-D-mannosaminyltransferase
MNQNRIQVRGVFFDNVTLDEAAHLLRAAARENRSGVSVFTPNSEIVQICLEDPSMREIINGGGMVVPDGIGVVKAARILGTPLKEKVAGVDLGRRVIAFAAEEGYPVALVGGKPGVAEDAASALRAAHPGLNICLTADGYFKKEGEENEAVLCRIRESGARIVFVCFGAPAQEKWIAQNRDKLTGVNLLLGLGGSLDVYSGHVKRAPAIFVRLGLEWLYRLLKEPKRIGRMMSLPKFYFGTWKYKLFDKQKGDAR